MEKITIGIVTFDRIKLLKEQFHQFYHNPTKIMKF